ncbi:MAG: ABC transporter substrate-binding protein [Proteobacteria bacterium]|nr:ABC transporter substrate-binding protein [Pseudomonadota bacterium]MBU2628836.1 ABC transporter substrate-binding protein [Pseudomonadota bacterium]
MIKAKLYVLLIVSAGLAAGFSASAALASVSILDAAGTSLVFEKLPERIVVVGQAPFIPLHMLYLFEETKDRLKGFEVKVKKNDAFLDLVDPGISSKQPLHSNPGPESVAALKPDLVIIKATVETAMARSLKPLGIPVMHVGAETPDMFLKDIENIGHIFGNEKRAGIIIQYYRHKLSLIREKVGTLSIKEKQKVLVLEYSNRGKNLSLNVPAQSWFQTRQALISGGNPVWLDSLNITDGWQITGFEQIAAWNPDKIFLIVWYQLKGPEVIKRLYQDSKWGRLNALQQNNLYLFPRDIYGWDSATPRWILGALWMAKKTYPQKFDRNELDMKTTVTEFFKLLYGLDELTITRQLMPELE